MGDFRGERPRGFRGGGGELISTIHDTRKSSGTAVRRFVAEVPA